MPSRCKEPSTASTERRVVPVWGTVVTVDVRQPVAGDLLDRVERWFHVVDERFSTWRADSEICRLGRGDVRLADVSDDVREVLDLCDGVRADTWGAFDVAVANDPRVVWREGYAPIDPSGLVKGWALDRAADILRQAEVHNFAINAGGDVLLAGHSGDGTSWRVGLQHPGTRDRVMGAITVTDAGVATSGRYERGDHVVAPRTGKPATALAAATVVTPTLAVADGYATGLLALGDDARRWLSEHPHVAALIVDADDVVVSTPAFERLRVT